MTSFHVIYRHLDLDLAGSSFVENTILYSSANNSVTLSISLKAFLVGASNTTSSAYTVTHMYTPCTVQPRPSLRNLAISSYMYTHQMAGEITEPCLVELLSVNRADMADPHRA